MCKNKDKTRFSIRKVCEIEQEDLTELFVGAIEEKQTGNKVEMQVTKVTDAMVLKKNKWTETLKVNKKALYFKLDMGAECNVIFYKDFLGVASLDCASQTVF